MRAEEMVDAALAGFDQGNWRPFLRCPTSANGSASMRLARRWVRTYRAPMPRSATRPRPLTFWRPHDAARQERVSFRLPKENAVCENRRRRLYDGADLQGQLLAMRGRKCLGAHGGAIDRARRHGGDALAVALGVRIRAVGGGDRSAADGTATGQAGQERLPRARRRLRRRGCRCVRQPRPGHRIGARWQRRTLERPRRFRPGRRWRQGEAAAAAMILVVVFISGPSSLGGSGQ